MMQKIGKYFQAITYWPVYLLLRLFVHFKIEGQENLKGLEDGAIIFASNHGRGIDGPFCAVSMPRNKGDFFPKKFFPVRFLAHKKFFSPRYLLIALYVWINGSIVIPRGECRNDEDMKNILTGAINAIRNKEKIWIFPEGRVSRDGQMGKGKRGVAFLHRETDAPIVPVALIGTAGLYSPLTFLGLKKVVVKIGKPIYSLGEGNYDLSEASQKVMLEIKKLML
ncbi:MAG: lysophospholipid acyltransferase family protein [Candidatus Parcubacteria bacterium]|nr:lysophospholipid acyltransferase family protein [Candidatus Parcubacteria bacterium]